MPDTVSGPMVVPTMQRTRIMNVFVFDLMIGNGSNVIADIHFSSCALQVGSSHILYYSIISIPCLLAVR